jgi:hypothetical protein
MVHYVNMKKDAVGEFHADSTPLLPSSLITATTRFVLDTRSGQRHSLRTIRRVVPDRQGCRASNPAIRRERYASRAARAGL